MGLPSLLPIFAGNASLYSSCMFIYISYFLKNKVILSSFSGHKNGPKHYRWTDIAQDRTPAPPFKAQINAVKTLICMALCRCWFFSACLEQSSKCLSIWSLCFIATWGKAMPNKAMAASITLTPSGSEPGAVLSWKHVFIQNASVDWHAPWLIAEWLFALQYIDTKRTGLTRKNGTGQHLMTRTNRLNQKLQKSYNNRVDPLVPLNLRSADDSHQSCPTGCGNDNRVTKEIENCRWLNTGAYSKANEP